MALLQRVEYVRSRTMSDKDLTLLGRLYNKGKNLGAQDPIVAALWCAMTLNGDCDNASHLLRDYLCVHRRERSLPDWWLNLATAPDSAWEIYYSRTGAPGMPP